MCRGSVKDQKLSSHMKKMNLVRKAIVAVRFLRVRLRSIFYYLLINAAGGECGRRLKVDGPVTIVGDIAKLRIGSDVSLNHGVLLNCRDVIELGDQVTISAGAQLQTAFLTGERMDHHSAKPIKIGQGSWIAAGVVVSAGAIVCENVVVGAMSLVRGELSSNALYAGVPAKKIREFS